MSEAENKELESRFASLEIKVKGSEFMKTESIFAFNLRWIT